MSSWAYRYRTEPEIGVLIADLRTRHGVSVERYCELSRATPERLAAIEAGASAVCGYDVAACETLFGIKAQQLLTTEPTMAEKFGVDETTPEPVRRSVEIFDELIDDYLGLEALVG